MTCVESALAAAGPFGAAGAVFELDAGGRQAVADGVGGGEVLRLAGFGAEVDDQLHHFGEQVVVGATPGCAGGL